MRRLILAVSTAVGGLLRVTGVARLIAPRHVVLERVTVQVPDLPPGLAGYTIGVLTDLHLGALVATEFVRRAAEMLASEQPDLVVVLGDLVSEESAVRELPVALAPLGGAAVGVWGNWDLSVEGAMEQRVVRMLVNEGFAPVPGLWVAGVDDTVLGEPDLAKALAGAPPAPGAGGAARAAVRILLAHEPDFAEQVKPEHNIALQLSGHSHGGQIRLPLVGPLMLPPGGRKYPMGLRQARACQVYTSRGVGTAHLPIRLFCPPEVTLITLR